MNELKYPKIIHNDEHFGILCKPAGWLSNNLGDNRPSVEMWLAENFPEVADIYDVYSVNGAELQRQPKSGIVHRLDFETSGVMIFAKTQYGYNELKSQFQNGAVRKKYLAICYGKIGASGVVDVPIMRSRSDFKKFTAGNHGRGRSRKAVTEYRLLKILEADGNVFSFAEITPRTGRTHQIRVHMNYLGHPIVGDKLYGGKLFKRAPAGNLGFERHALHAWKISFVFGERKFEFECPLPEDFEEVAA